MTTMLAVPALAGPQLPLKEAARHPFRYLLPLACFLAAAALLVFSIRQPYWKLILHAPQYPHGLRVVGYVDHITGDVSELDELNHYIGMRPLNEAAKLEKSMAITVLWAFAIILLIDGSLIHNRKAAYLVLPALLFPVLFLLDLHYWLHNFGHHLDPHAPLSLAIKPFTPPVLGEGKIAQFRTVAGAGPGLVLASYASLLIVIGLVLHRWAYKPLVDKARNAVRAAAANRA